MGPQEEVFRSAETRAARQRSMRSYRIEFFFSVRAGSSNTVGRYSSTVKSTEQGRATNDSRYSLRP